MYADDHHGSGLIRLPLGMALFGLMLQRQLSMYLNDFLDRFEIKIKCYPNI